MDLRKQLGYYRGPANTPGEDLIEYINLKLAAIGCPTFDGGGSGSLHHVAAALLENHREKERLLRDRPCPGDSRVEDFLRRHLGDDYPAGEPILPRRTFTLDRHGLARALSLPPDKDKFSSNIIQSFRVKQGILHNPDKDRRTTAGVFHVAEGGLPVPEDKKAVPRKVFANMLRHALNPPPELLRLPFTSTREKQAESFVSLYLRPTVCPEVPGFRQAKRMEIRFFAPGNLTCNLDFVESIFGNAGDPFLAANDAGLDAEGWSGHTGCVILATHLVGLRKKEIGLPAWDDATERQRRDGMCWKEEDELYNGGGAFKLTCRDESGVIVTLIADNYFGYCKKEVKTQISYAANLMGMAEEEHAGGTLAFPSYDLGDDLLLQPRVKRYNHTFAEMVKICGDLMDLQPAGYGIDRKFKDILYVPENAHFSLHKLTVSWKTKDGKQSIRLLPGKYYVRPSGYKVRIAKAENSKSWRLIGTLAEGLFCHKPSTVSGGGKSEISKPITDAILRGPVFVGDLKEDLDQVEALLNHDYDERFREKRPDKTRGRSILSEKRSLGSVIKLLTPSATEYTDEYNKWLRAIPSRIKNLVHVVKRHYRSEWGDNWREHFQGDMINGQPGHELKCDDRRLSTDYIRVGYESDGSWRVFGLRDDFFPAAKLQMEDDISASLVVPVAKLDHLPEEYAHDGSVKFVHNCEFRFFQRPDEAVHPGHDKQTEQDFTHPRNFLSNYEPLRPGDARELLEDSIGFENFTPPMQNLIREAAVMDKPDYFVCTARPRVVDGKPSKNPRFLQDRADLVNPVETYLASTGIRLFRRLPADAPLRLPVGAVLPGRRNNPPDPASNLRSLAVFNPIHYLELPELFMEFTASMTGKSPSTTGAGSEGALTKGPFNALLPVTDLNNALVSYILTGLPGFITAGGSIGPSFRIDHDISLLVPEIWCRMTPEERVPGYLIGNGFLEKVDDFEHNGKPVSAGRLGYRINRRFINYFFGRVFTDPGVIFTEEMLRPELQDMEAFVDGLDNMVSTARRVATHYFEDGSIELACPPLRALLHIMAEGSFEGATVDDPAFRALFTRENMLQSDWYRERLVRQNRKDRELAARKLEHMEAFLKRPSHADIATELDIAGRVKQMKEHLSRLDQRDPAKELAGTLGRDRLRPEEE